MTTLLGSPVDCVETANAARATVKLIRKCPNLRGTVGCQGKEVLWDAHHFRCGSEQLRKRYRQPVGCREFRSQ